MTTTINKILLATAVLIAVFAGISFFMGSTAQAQTSCGSCGYNQSNYYSQGAYKTYSQSDYYSQGAYKTYSQSDYYSQGTYNTYSQSSYSTYSQSSYSTPAPRCDKFEITPDKLPKNGGEVTLTWETTNATEVKLDGEIVSDDGSKKVNVTSDKTFTLKVKGVASDVECSKKVTVEKDTYSQSSYNTYSQGSYNSYSQGSYGGGGSSSPRCDLDISAKKIKKGKEVTIEWKTSNATDILLKDNHGKTLIDTDDLSSKDKKEFLDGEIKVRPTKDTTYTLIAEKGSKDDECKVKIEVEDEVVVLETRDQKPFVQGIALTHVPYTGFEAGPVLTFIFYALLTIWALFVAYVLVIKKKAS